MIHEEISADRRDALRLAPPEFADAFAESAGVGKSQDVVSRAASLVGRPGCRIHCGITLVTVEGTPETIAATDDIPIRLDRLQRELGHGPSMPSVHTEALVVSGELSEDLRWPDFGVMCVSVLGIRSLLSVRIPIGEQGAFLTFSSEAPAAFDDRDTESATEFARLAVPAARRGWRELNAFSAAEVSSRTGRLSTALRIVMAHYRLSPAMAFEMLNQSSQVLRWSLLSMAAEVVHTGRLPARDIPDVHRRPPTAAEGTGLASPHPAGQLTA